MSLLPCPSQVALSWLHPAVPSCRTRHLQLRRRPGWGWSQPEALPGQGHEDRPGRAAAADPHLPGGHSGHAAAEVRALPGADHLRPLPHPASLQRGCCGGLGSRGLGARGAAPGQAMVMGTASLLALGRGVQESRSPCPQGTPRPAAAAMEGSGSLQEPARRQGSDGWGCALALSSPAPWRGRQPLAVSPAPKAAQPSPPAPCGNDLLPRAGSRTAPRPSRSLPRSPGPLASTLWTSAELRS